MDRRVSVCYSENEIVGCGVIKLARPLVYIGRGAVWVARIGHGRYAIRHKRPLCEFTSGVQMDVPGRRATLLLRAWLRMCGRDLRSGEPTLRDGQ